MFFLNIFHHQIYRSDLQVLFNYDLKCLLTAKILLFDRYSLISMRPIYYFDTWAIIWHGIVCWFVVFSPFLPVLVCCDHKIVLHWYENQNKNNFVLKCCKFLANLCKSSKILEHYHVKWWLKYRNNRSVSWSLSCT